MQLNQSWYRGSTENSKKEKDKTKINTLELMKQRILKDPLLQTRPSGRGDGTNRFDSNIKPEHEINWQYRHDDIQRVDNLFNEMKPIL